MRARLSILVAGLALIPIAAQALMPQLSDLDSVPLALVRAPLAKQIESAAEKSAPLQFAVKVPLALGLPDGLWDTIDLDTARWRLRVRSPEATSLSFEFARFDLPDGAQLWVYDAAGALVQGPYKAADASPAGQLWTAMVLGEEAVIELRVAPALAGQVALTLASVAHGFRDLAAQASSSATGSDSCNIDVACPQGDDWREEIRAVARVSIDSTFTCSGEALNNSRQDNDPLFITANHCGIGQNLCGADHAQYCDPSSVVVYWNYQDSACRPNSGARTRNGSLAQNQTGATLLASDVGSDFTLLRLNSAPSDAFNVYMSGWNATSSVPQSGVAIHHPGGDEKSISLYSSPAERADTCIEGTVDNCSRDVHAWGVHWSAGTTQQGSSGGGLWDQNHLLVGWLSGGLASCSNPDQEDFFARMETAWTAGSQDDQQLKHWLAPDRDVKTLCGRNRSSGACDAAVTAATVTEQRGGSLDWLALLPLVLLGRARARASGSTCSRSPPSG